MKVPALTAAFADVQRVRVEEIEAESVLADPSAGLSFGYTMNQMGPGILMNQRGQSLVDATYRSLGYRSKDGGVWIR